MELLEGEVFKPLNVEGYEKYLVSNKGRVMRDNKIRKTQYNKDGYETISLCVDYQSKSMRVHRMVALTFLEQKDVNKNVVNHIDNNRSNNEVSNLEWVSVQENVTHSIENGNRDLSKWKEIVKKATSVAVEKNKKKLKLEKEGKVKVYDSVVEASIDTGLERRRLSELARGIMKKYKGYTGKYI